MDSIDLSAEPRWYVPVDVQCWAQNHPDARVRVLWWCWHEAYRDHREMLDEAGVIEARCEAIRGIARKTTDIDIAKVLAESEATDE